MNMYPFLTEINHKPIQCKSLKFGPRKTIESYKTFTNDLIIIKSAGTGPDTVKGINQANNQGASTTDVQALQVFAF
jgi:hypothetical protein